MARYDFGVERRIYVHDLADTDVDRVVQELVEQAQSVKPEFWKRNNLRDI